MSDRKHDAGTHATTVCAELKAAAYARYREMTDTAMKRAVGNILTAGLVAIREATSLGALERTYLSWRDLAVTEEIFDHIAPELISQTALTLTKRPAVQPDAPSAAAAAALAPADDHGVAVSYSGIVIAWK
jgi:hypothetical protein